MRSLSFLMILVLICVGALGFVLAGSDLMNPKTSDALARKMNAETDAYIAEKGYEQGRQQIELKALEQEAAIKAEALATRYAKELESMERISQLKARLIELAVVVGLAVIAVLSGAGAFHLLCTGFALLRQPQQLAPGVRQEEGRVIPFPGLPQRTRVLANTPATALALLVLGVAVLTVSVTLL